VSYRGIVSSEKIRRRVFPCGRKKREGDPHLPLGKKRKKGNSRDCLPRGSERRKASLSVLGGTAGY